MKTIKQVNNEINELLQPYRNDKKKKIKGRTKTKLHQLREVVMHLETYPSEDFVKGELEKTEIKLKVIEDRFEIWKESIDQSTLHKAGDNLKGYYENLYDVAKIKKQIKTLKYILN